MRAHRWARLRGDGGFILLESMIAISLITVIMAAIGVEYVTGVRATSHARTVTTATAVADTAVEALRALDPTDLLTGRDRTSVTGEYTTLSAISGVGPAISAGTKLAYGSTSARISVPTDPTPKAAGLSLTFQVYDYLECYAPSTDGSCRSTAATLNYIRAIVVVTWSQSGCPGGTCSYTTSTLINADVDPTFDINQALPPAPLIAPTPTQVVAVGDVVALQLTARNGTGVAPFTWATTATSGALPNGLTLNSTGLISGTVQADAAPASSVTIQLTDAFLRKTTVTFSWTVKPPLVFGTVNNQTSLTTDTVNLLLTATGGSGSGYTYTDPSRTLPPGLTLSSAGRITGTPSIPAPHTYSVRLTVTDSTGTRSATTPTPLTWTVNYPPLGVTDPLTQASTLNTAITPLAMAASGGDGAYTWTVTSLPAGLTMSSTGRITGTPTAVGSSPVTVTVADASAGVANKSQSFTWNVYAAPTIATPGTQKNTIGAAVSLSVPATTCPNASCSYSLANAPNGLAIAPTTGLISGTIAAGASTSSTVTVTVTDKAGAAVSTANFTWTIYPQPTLTGLTTHSVTETDADSVAISYTCPYINCTIALSGSVPGLGLTTSATSTTDNTLAKSLTVSSTSGFVYITGTVLTSAVTAGTSKAYIPKLTITASDGVQPAPSTATWTAYTPPTLTGLADNSAARRSVATQAITWNCPTASCTIDVVVASSPAWFKIGATTSPTQTSIAVATTGGTINAGGTLPNQKGAPTVTLTITDSNGAVTTVTATWTVT